MVCSGSTTGGTKSVEINVNFLVNHQWFNQYSGSTMSGMCFH